MMVTGASSLPSDRSPSGGGTISSAVDGAQSWLRRCMAAKLRAPRAIANGAGAGNQQFRRVITLKLRKGCSVEGLNVPRNVALAGRFAKAAGHVR